MKFKLLFVFIVSFSSVFCANPFSYFAKFKDFGAYFLDFYMKNRESKKEKQKEENHENEKVHELETIEKNKEAEKIEIQEEQIFDSCEKWNLINKIIIKKLEEKFNLEEIGIKNNETSDILEARENVFYNILILEKKIKNKEIKAKIAYLTFDDGPYEKTYKFLDILDENNIKATFFLLGKEKVKTKDDKKVDAVPIYKAIFGRGHTIANHTYSHKIKKGLYESCENFMNGVNKNIEYFEKMGLPAPNIVRFPGGSATAGKLKKEIKEKLYENNMGWVDWSASCGDGKDIKDSDVAWKEFVDTVNEDIEVVLFHDYSSVTLKLLPKMIKYLKEQGYILLPLQYDSCMVHKKKK